MIEILKAGELKFPQDIKINNSYIIPLLTSNLINNYNIQKCSKLMKSIEFHDKNFLMMLSLNKPIAQSKISFYWGINYFNHKEKMKFIYKTIQFRINYLHHLTISLNNKKQLNKTHKLTLKNLLINMNMNKYRNK